MGITGLADVITDFFFDELEVVGAEHVPLDRPVILAANHHSGLIDALLLYATSPRDLRAIGKSTLWKILPLRPFLAAARVIPVYRHRDGGGDNRGSFAEVAASLAANEAVAIFVEGTSHDAPGLAPIKTGAARMAFDAVGAGVAPVVVPVGLVFEDRERFRSDALVRFGEPIDVAAGYPSSTSEDRDAVRALTAQIERRLRIVAPTWESETQRAAARSSAFDALPLGASLSEVEAEAERIAELLDTEELGPPNPELVGPRGEAHLQIPPDDINQVDTLIAAPLAFAGKWLNAIPYFGVRQIAHRGALNLRATLKTAAGLVLFPIWWAVVGCLAWVLGASVGWAIATVCVVAFLGVFAARELPVASDERRTLRSLRRRNRQASAET